MKISVLALLEQLEREQLQALLLQRALEQARLLELWLEVAKEAHVQAMAEEPWVEVVLVLFEVEGVEVFWADAQQLLGAQVFPPVEEMLLLERLERSLEAEEARRDLLLASWERSKEVAEAQLWLPASSVKVMQV